MRLVRMFSMPLAAALVLGACSEGFDQEQPQGRPSASTAASNVPGPSGGDRSSLSGRIAFDNFDDVWTINADGTDLTRLTHSSAPEFHPSWSPDGTRIAYRSERSGDPEIWVMNAEGTGQRRLTDGLSPAWSPDGSRVAFNSNLTGDHVMYIAQADGSEVVDLSRVGEGWQVAWSPDGRSILFTSHRDHPDNYTDVYVMRPDGSGVRRLTHDVGQTPTWSPDGDHIVFSAPSLFIMDPHGSDVRALPTPGVVGETQLPDWTD